MKDLTKITWSMSEYEQKYSRSNKLNNEFDIKKVQSMK